MKNHNCKSFVPAYYIATRGRKQKCWCCPECGKLLKLEYDTGCLVTFETERARIMRGAIKT